MLVNFDVVLKDAFGEEFTELKPVRGEDGKRIIVEGKPKTEEVEVFVSKAVADALYAQLESDKELDGKASIALHSLAQRVIEGGERSYTMEELVDIKLRVLKTKPRIIYARVCECVDSAKPEPTKAE